MAYGKLHRQPKVLYAADEEGMSCADTVAFESRGHVVHKHDLEQSKYWLQTGLKKHYNIPSLFVNFCIAKTRLGEQPYGLDWEGKGRV